MGTGKVLERRGEERFWEKRREEKRRLELSLWKIKAREVLALTETEEEESRGVGVEWLPHRAAGR